MSHHLQSDVHLKNCFRLTLVLTVAITDVCCLPFQACAEKLESSNQLAPMQLIAIPESDNQKLYTIAFAPDGRTVVASIKRPTQGEAEYRIAVVDLSKGRLKRLVTQHRCHVSRMTFSPDGSSLAVTGNDPQIVLLNGKTFKLKKRILLTEKLNCICAARFSANGKLFATLDSGRNIQIWDVSTWTERNKVKDATSRLVPSISLSADGKLVAVADSVYDVAMLSVTSGKQLQHYNGQPGGLTDVFIAPTVDVHLSRDGSRLLCAWNREILRLSKDGTVKLTSLESASVWLGVLSNDGSLYVTGSQRGDVIVWDTSSGKEVRRLSGHKGASIRSQSQQITEQ